MPKPYPPEFRCRALDLVTSGAWSAMLRRRWGSPNSSGYAKTKTDQVVTTEACQPSERGPPPALAGTSASSALSADAPMILNAAC